MLRSHAKVIVRLRFSRSLRYRSVVNVSQVVVDSRHNVTSPQVDSKPISSSSLKFYIETYGCQMNLSDSEIVRSILIDSGYEACSDVESTDIILTNTCAVRENAESKVWNRLKFFQSIRKKNRVKGRRFSPIVGVLGCMAERLKEKLLLEDSVDFVCGPDSYRDIPSLLQSIVNVGQKQANTMLSFDETYADIKPVREVNSASAFVSIMRGCNNMCSFCIVPFTRGRERSRPMASILSEIKALSDTGVKEVVLLGQNVNGYHDTSDASSAQFPVSAYKVSSSGFTNLYQSRNRDKAGARFADLLHSVADINPNMRIRFTSPHPKDFPAEVLEAISSRTNICKSIHLPVQSGSSSMLHRMRRGYSREAYLELVRSFRELIPGVSISTDVIAGFCDETEEEHRDTLSLLAEVRFDQAFMYTYSLRDRTHAAHNMVDNVPEDVKKRRLQEIIDTYRSSLLLKNTLEETGQLRLVLVEGHSTKSTPQRSLFTGRTEGNKRVVFPASGLLPLCSLLSILRGRGVDVGSTVIAAPVASASAEVRSSMAACTVFNLVGVSEQEVSGMADYLSLDAVVGQYAVVRVVRADSSTLRGVAIGSTTLEDFYRLKELLCV